MAELKVIWTNRALVVFQKTVYWYAAIWEYNSLSPLQRM